MTLCDLGRLDARCQNFKVDLLINARTAWHRTTKFSRTHKWRRRVFLAGQQCPYRKAAGSQRSPILGFLSIYAYTLWRRTTKFGVVTYMGRGLFLGVSHSPPQRGGAPAFPIFGVLFYLCVHPLTQNYQIWRGNTCWEGRVSRDQPRLQSQESEILGLPNFWDSLVFMLTPFNSERPNSAWWHISGGCVLDQPRHCTCTNASRGLSATAKFLVNT